MSRTQCMKSSQVTSGWLLCFLCRYPKKLELFAHVVLGAESFWDLLHFGCSWTLLHRCLHCLLHHHETLSVLSHAGEHKSLSAKPESQDLVSHVLLFWMQCQWYSPKWILLALFKANHIEKVNRLKNTQLNWHLLKYLQLTFFKKCWAGRVLFTQPLLWPCSSSPNLQGSEETHCHFLKQHQHQQQCSGKVVKL